MRYWRVRQAVQGEDLYLPLVIRKERNGMSLAIESSSRARIGAAIGRTELEEFGIVNVPCPLNKFQRGKRLSGGKR